MGERGNLHILDISHNPYMSFYLSEFFRDVFKIPVRRAAVEDIPIFTCICVYLCMYLCVLRLLAKRKTMQT